jgi:hypothetical protein
MLQYTKSDQYGCRRSVTSVLEMEAGFPSICVMKLKIIKLRHQLSQQEKK